jgi:hypothetical protein
MWFSWYIWAALALIAGGALWMALRCRSKGKFLRAARAGAACVFAAMTLFAAAIGGYLGWWYSGRSSPVQKELFQGVKYLRLPGKSLRMFVAHLLFIDLRATNLSFFVTPADLDTLPSMRASTVTQFLERHQLQVAINANFFHPFHSNNPWDFYPRTGDIVQVLGIAASEGRQYSTQVWAGATAYISKSNRVQIGGGSDNFWNAVAGDQWLVRDGMNVGVSDTFGRYPRAAIGVNRTGDKSILAVVDGKQPGYSEGLTLP